MRNFIKLSKEIFLINTFRHGTYHAYKILSKYLNNNWYGHTSSVLAKKFVEEVVLKWDIFK